jgi:alpha-beta hydrolase superfamily lysophospholipase
VRQDLDDPRRSEVVTRRYCFDAAATSAGGVLTLDGLAKGAATITGTAVTGSALGSGSLPCADEEAATANSTRHAETRAMKAAIMKGVTIMEVAAITKVV